MPTSVAFAAPPAEDVGDADSFGRDVRYLGAKSGQFVYLNQNCAGLGPISDRCVNINSTGANVIDQPNLIVIKLPAFATRSLVCFSITTFVSYRFANNGAAKQQSLFTVRPLITIDSTALNNSAIVDPITNLPLNGRITTSIGAYNDQRTLMPGDVESASQSFSRECIGGLISKSALQSYGMSSLQIAAFFATPMTITLSAGGNITRAETGAYQYGLRLFGD